MQKAFGRVERVTICLAAISLMLVLTSTRGGAPALVVSLAFLSLFYFVGGYFQPVEVGQKPSIAVSLVKIMSGMTLSTLVIGALFKIMLWGGAATMLLVGTVGTLFIAVVIFALTRAQGHANGVIQRCVAWACLSAVVFFISPTALFAMHHPNDPVLIEKFNVQEVHPNDLSYKADFEAYRRQHYAQKSAQ